MIQKTHIYRTVTVGADGYIRNNTIDFKSLVVDGRKIMSIRPSVTQCYFMGLRRPVSEVTMLSGEIYDVIGTVGELEERFKPTQKEMEDAQ